MEKPQFKFDLRKLQASFGKNDKPRFKLLVLIIMCIFALVVIVIGAFGLFYPGGIFKLLGSRSP